MMTIHEGKPGSGKSFCGVLEMISLLCRGCYVATNMPVFFEKIQEFLLDFYSLEYPGLMPLKVFEDGLDLIKFNYTEMPKGTRTRPNVVIFDEAQIHLNSRDWKKNHEVMRDYLDYLTHHRHYSHDLMFMTQDASMIDSQIRRLAQYFVRYRDLKRFAVPVLGPIYPFEHTMAIRLDYDCKTVLDRKIVNRDQKIFKLYDSENALQDEHFKGSLMLPKPVFKRGNLGKTFLKRLGDLCGF